MITLSSYEILMYLESGKIQEYTLKPDSWCYTFSILRYLSIMTQKIRIKLKSYDHNLIDKSAEKIVKAVKATNAVVSGPIPLPTDKEKFTVLRSPHVNKESREQFQLCTYKRLVDIYSTSTKTIDALMKLELPSGVDVQIKVWFFCQIFAKGFRKRKPFLLWNNSDNLCRFR